MLVSVPSIDRQLASKLLECLPTPVNIFGIDVGAGKLLAIGTDCQVRPRFWQSFANHLSPELDRPWGLTRRYSERIGNSSATSGARALNLQALRVTLAALKCWRCSPLLASNYRSEGNHEFIESLSTNWGCRRARTQC